MKDNTTGAQGVEVYEHDIFYYADEYITNTLNIIPGDDNYKEIVRDNFNDMLFYIKNNIIKPDKNDIELLNEIFNIYIRLCVKYNRLPTINMFCILTGLNNTVISNNYHNNAKMSNIYKQTVKMWLDTCKGFTIDRLHNQTGANANLIFIAKANYGMAETAPIQTTNTEALPDETREQIAAKYAAYADLPAPEPPEL